MNDLSNDKTHPRRYGFIRSILFAVVSAVVLGCGWYWKVSIREGLDTITQWIDTLDSWGPPAFVLIYSIATVAMLPGTILSVAAGALFGAVMGVVWVSAGSTLGAGACFLIARYLARDAVANWLSHHETFKKLDSMTEDLGAVVVAITRLVPLFPFNLLNYGFGLTRVPFSTYLFWSWLCMIPGTVLYVGGAATLKEVLARGEIPWLHLLVLLLVVGIITVISGRARKILREHQQRSEKTEPKTNA